MTTGRLRVGFTGSRTDPTPDQFDWIYDVLRELYVPGAWLHHGDCVGKDVLAHQYGQLFGYRIEGHPPVVTTYRAYCDCDVYREAAPYRDRNRAIVDAVDLLVACPDTLDDAPESIRSGTWQTIRYARRRNVPVRLFIDEVPVNGPA